MGCWRDESSLLVMIMLHQIKWKAKRPRLKLLCIEQGKLMTVQPDIGSLFSRIPFQNHTRLELLDDFRVRAPDIVELKNHLGTMHGGMLYAVGEVAAAVAMAKLLEPDRATLYGITRHGDIAYLKPARGAITSSCDIAMTRSDILAALEHERSIDVPVTVTLSDQAHVVVAKLNMTWYVAPRR